MKNPINYEKFVQDFDSWREEKGISKVKVGESLSSVPYCNKSNAYRLYMRIQKKPHNLTVVQYNTLYNIKNG